MINHALQLVLIREDDQPAGSARGLGWFTQHAWASVPGSGLGIPLAHTGRSRALPPLLLPACV